MNGLGSYTTIRPATLAAETSPAPNLNDIDFPHTSKLRTSRISHVSVTDWGFQCRGSRGELVLGLTSIGSPQLFRGPKYATECRELKLRADGTMSGEFRSGSRWSLYKSASIGAPFVYVAEMGETDRAGGSMTHADGSMSYLGRTGRSESYLLDSGAGKIEPWQPEHSRFHRLDRHPSGAAIGWFTIEGEQRPRLFYAKAPGAPFEKWEAKGVEGVLQVTVHPDGSVSAWFEGKEKREFFHAATIGGAFEPWGPKGADYMVGEPIYHRDGGISATFSVNGEWIHYHARSIEGPFEVWETPHRAPGNQPVLHPDGSTTLLPMFQSSHLRAESPHAPFRPWEVGTSVGDAEAQCLFNYHEDGSVTECFRYDPGSLGLLRRHSREPASQQVYRAAAMGEPFVAWGPAGSGRCSFILPIDESEKAISICGFDNGLFRQMRDNEGTGFHWVQIGTAVPDPSGVPRCFVLTDSDASSDTPHVSAVIYNQGRLQYFSRERADVHAAKVSDDGLVISLLVHDRKSRMLSVQQFDVE